MDSVTVFVDNENGALMLSAPEGTTGEADVTVTVDDGQGGTDSKQFHVSITPDPENGNPYLEDIGDLQTTRDTAVSFTLPGVDVEGDAMYYDGFAYDPDDLLVDVDHATGLTTVTPMNGLVGAHKIFVGVRAATAGAAWDSQVVPVMIIPEPSTIALLCMGAVGLLLYTLRRRNSS
ncbi:hypothetical protein LCGC14_2491420 [marine sediment metagenome]|uniref:Ice-binding protein C-terminal domain-containing protein n=1 Tax=marine sediment metagenome TaxID=412755 RepID=A0A0F9DYC7_9ZZZZ